MAGLLIAIEGIDGTGKTTQIKLLAKYLEKNHIKFMITSEPTDREFGKKFRENLKKPQSDPMEDAKIIAIDRKDHYFNVILPAIQSGAIVITDRYKDSSLAYQSIQCRDHFNNNIALTLDWVNTLNNEVPHANFTFLLDADPANSLKRRYAETNSSDIEKFEKADFLTLVRKQFLYCTQRDPDSYYIIDATRSIAEIQCSMINRLKSLDARL